MSTNTTNAQEASSKSTQTFISALVLNAAIAGIELAAFLAIRNGFPRIYQPRVDLPSEGKRQEPLPRRTFDIIPAVIRADPRDIVRVNGLDAYLFVRFIKLLIEIFLPIAIVTWIVLLPVYGTSTGRNEGMNIFVFGNVGTDQQARLWAPLILSWACTLYALFMIYREYGRFIGHRREFLTSKDWSTRPQSRTVLVTGIPNGYCSMDKLHELTAHLPGGVRKIWLARDVGDLQDVYDRRIKAGKKLEKAHVKLIKLAAKLVRKNKPLPGTESADTEKAGSSHASTAPTLMKYVAEKKRPTARVGGKIPFITGKKVDTIDWATEEISKTTEELETRRSDIQGSFQPKSAAFILFNDQITAHMFARTLGKGKSPKDLPLRLAARFTDVNPDDVIWNRTLSINGYAAKVRKIISISITVAVIVFWSIITAFVTSISNVSNLCTKVSWLSWLCQLPTPVNGILQGVLPPVVLALLFMLLPPFFRFLAVFQGTPLHSRVELSLQKRYFAFLFVQGFIVATLASGIMAGITQITNDPGSTVSLLAQNLPKASIFFLTLIVTSGLSGAAGGILQIAKLVIYYVKVILLGGSPRALWKIKYTMPDVKFGQAYPAQLLLVVIAISYSTIAPLVAGFASLTFGLYYFMFKYGFLWIFDQPASRETAGLHFKTALNQMFAGIYIQLLCLTGLFFLARNTGNGLSAIPQGVLSVVLLLFTIAFQIFLHFKYGRHVEYLPDSMADEMNANEKRYAQEMAAERQAGFQNGVVGAGKENPQAVVRTLDDGKAADGPGHSSMLHPTDSNNTAHHSATHAATAGSAFDANNAGFSAALPVGDQLAAPQSQDLGRSDSDTTRLDGHAERARTGEDYEELSDMHDHAFHHPALWKPQPMLWLPHDSLGLSQEAVANAKAGGVDMTDEDATINEKGKIDVTRNTLPGQGFE